MKISKRITAAISGVLCVVCCCAVLAACSGEKSLYDWEFEAPSGVDFHTELQANFLNETDFENNYNINKYAQGTEELSRPSALKFSWKATAPAGTEATVKDYIFEIAEDRAFTDAWTYQTNKTEIGVYNLKIATDYYYRVTLNLSDGNTVTSRIQNFTTIDSTPRNLYVDGVANVRDLGGWKTVDGGRVKQGMIIRGGELNKNSTVRPTDAGKRVLLDEIGIKSEIDLRINAGESGGITKSPLGDSVKYNFMHLDYAATDENGVLDMMTGNKEMLNDIFALLADENNYPFYYHCRIGTDRTGMLAYLINGMCGVSKEDLCRDYLFSNFGNIESSRDLPRLLSEGYVPKIEATEGATYAEKIYNRLAMIGVKTEYLDAVIRIMTE